MASSQADKTLKYPAQTMFYSFATFIGIDPTAGQRPFVYAALDSELRLLALGHGEMEEVLAFTAGQSQAMVAVCAPRQPNQGLMEQQELRERLSPPPKPGRWRNYRVVEYLLRQRNISSPQVAASAEDCPNWMQMGFTLHRRLEGLGYRSYPAGQATHQSLEVYPHASYTVLLGQAPFPKHMLEGRLQRQLVLYERKINLPDPMRFFEEITRHKLLKGILSDDHLYTPGELDALIAAYTAWKATNQPEDVSLLGDPGEGRIVLPVAEILARY